jgi:ABC-2 type transport system ATP-binding protein
MSVIVDGITKLYGSQKALDNVTFEVNRGEVVGLLGPNGAGKSTLMKIITCFIPPTSGSIRVEGFDIDEQSLEVRRRVGYLPEHNPLYLEMYVREYLEFVAKLHKLGKATKSRINDMIEITGLQLEQKKKIGALSKGYRQRVGLAQAMIHDPEVLILDEPTSGLDPNQLAEIRELISRIGKEKTVMLSTHIMQEVEAICGRAIIINLGKIVADDSTKNLSKQIKGRNLVIVEFNKEVDQKTLMKLEGVINVTRKGENLFELETPSDKDLRDKIFAFAVENELIVLSLNKTEQRLEDVFRELTSSK